MTLNIINNLIMNVRSQLYSKDMIDKDTEILKIEVKEHLLSSSNLSRSHTTDQNIVYEPSGSEVLNESDVANNNNKL